jgi:FkbM family methyltransferase
VLLDLSVLIRAYRMRPTGVLHIGAHAAEEAPVYERCAIDKVWWVEANPELLPGLRTTVEHYPGHGVIEAAVDAADGERVAFYVTNSSQASPLLDFGTHAEHHPGIHVERTVQVRAATVDTLAERYDFSGINLLNLDIQGAELRAMRGGANTLDQVDYVYTEVNAEEVYRGCALVGEIDEFLGRMGLVRVKTTWDLAGWGDALYIRGGIGVAGRVWAQIVFAVARADRWLQRTAPVRALARAIGR